MNIFSQILEGRITKDLTIILSNIAEDAKRNASWSTKIPGAIGVTTVTKSGDGTYSGAITLNLKDAPEARAFEKGSGIHGEKGQTYVIAPRSGKYLIFPVGSPPQGRWPKYSGPVPAGDSIAIGKVDHPGVEARPYIAPAVEKNRKDIRFRLSRAFIGAYRDFVPRVTIIEA